MEIIDRQILLIKCLDREAHVGFSEYTKKWYVVANIEIGNGSVLKGIPEHCDTPQLAVEQYFETMKAVGTQSGSLDEYLVTGGNSPERIHWRWNGAGFMQIQF
jgi:hypothetical protein